MSKDTTTDILLNWFKENLPKDYDLQDEITKKAEKVLKHIRMDSPQQVNQPIFIGVSNHPNDPYRLTISMNVYGIIFLGVMAKAILDSLSGEFQALLSSEIGKAAIEESAKREVARLVKRYTCTSCQNVNRPGANYCDGCGKKLKDDSE